MDVTKTTNLAFIFLIILSLGEARCGTKVLKCYSWGYKFTTCKLPGKVTHVDVTFQKSHAMCVPRKTYGYKTKYLWVDKGCRATFKVKYCGA